MNFTTYLIDIIRPLVNHPDEVKITSTIDDMGTLLTLTLAAGDMRTVIGKAGDTAKAIRRLVHVVGMRQQIRVTLRITEPDGTIYKPSVTERT